MGCKLHPGGRQCGDYLAIDAAARAGHPDGEHCHAHRAKNIAIPERRRVFPVREDLLRHHNPGALRRYLSKRPDH
eukprot:5079165-Pyramimonas_sp.AAC.1